MKSRAARRLQRHLRQSRLIPEGTSCLVALSGGGDSMALLHLLKELEVPIRAAHLDHSLREDSAEDRAFVRAACREAGVPLTSSRVDVASLARQHDLSVEEAGRWARYRFLQAARRRHGMGCIATAHTADDQAETVLLRILSGTGVAGLGGIRPRRRDGVVRPLLPFTREDLRDYLRSRGLAWREDPTNLVAEAPRTRVRLVLLPLLQEWNPRIVEALGRLSRSARADHRFLDHLAGKMDSTPPLDAGALRRLPQPLRMRLLARAVGGGLESSHLEALDGLVQGPAGREVHLPGDRVAWRGFRLLHIEDRSQAPAAPPEVVVRLDGPTDLPEWGVRLVPSEAPGAEASRPEVIHLDLDRLALPLTVRSRRAGDRFRPAGGAGTVKLKKFLHERQVERRDRDRVPLLTSQGRIVWVVGHRADERFLAGPGTARVLRLEARPLT